MSDAIRFSRYSALIRRNSGQLLLYTAVLLVLLGVVAYMALQNIQFGLPVAFISGVYFLYLILKIDEILGLSTVAYSAASGISRTADKATISADIERMLEAYEVGYPIPQEVDVVWEESAEENLLWQDNQELICLDDSDHIHKNACKSAFRFSRRHIVQPVRSFLAPPVNTGLDTFVSEDIIRSAATETTYIDPDAARGLLFEELAAKLDVDSWDAIDAVHGELNDVRDAGFFGPVLLREYAKLSEAGVPSSDVKTETRDFLMFLDEISSRSPGGAGQLAFPGQTINVGIGIVGGQRDAEFYEQLALKSFAKYETTYILAEGEKIPLLKTVHDKLKDRPGVAQWHETEYPFRDQSRFEQGYCVQYEVSAGQVGG